MTLYERLEELRTTTNLETNPHEAYAEAEATLVSLLAEQIKDAEIITTAWGKGKVVEAQGINIDSMVMDIAFENSTKRFAVEPVISGKVFFTKFADNDELRDAWNVVLGFHTELTRQYIKIKYAEAEAAREAVKKAAADLKAEEKYQRQRDKAIRDFETIATQEKEAVTYADEFYYSLGWLANHVGSMTAILPDYLGPAFEKYFGAETPKTLVDSRAKTIGGHAKQWSWEFKCTIKKLKETVVPAYIQNITTDFSKGIHNTSFLWDLVENYGFQFGKEQDVEKIRACVPFEYTDVFEAGLAA